jgi:hypothetical protein
MQSSPLYSPNSVRAELVEALFFFSIVNKGQPFDKAQGERFYLI